MANLSNINNILRTSSAGVGINCDAEFSLDIEKASANAILSLNSSGGSGAEYLLYSGTSGEFVLNKRYVGDRLTISSGGNATFSNEISAGDDINTTGKFFANATNAELRLKSTNNSTGTSLINFADPDDNDVGQIKYLHSNNEFQFRSTDALALTLDYDAATFAGNITFGDSHFIGNDGDDNLLIQSSAGENIVLDSADDIVLDADGADVVFKDAGTAIGRFKNTGGNFVIKSEGSNDDLIFKGNDGGSEITALTLDMSAGGEVQLNSYGSGTFTGTTAYTLAVDSSGNIIETTDGGGTVKGTGTATRVAFWSASDTISSNANLYWDNSNDRLGLGTTTPQKALHIEGASGASASQLLVCGPSDTIGDTAGILLRAEGGEGDSALRAKGGIFFEREAANGLGKLHLCNNNSNNNDSADLSDAVLTILQDGQTSFVKSDNTSTPAGSINHASNDFLYVTGGTGGASFGDDSHATRMIIYDNDYVRFDTGGSERMRINSSGNVGIGNTSPAAFLHIGGAPAISAEALIARGNASGEYAVSIEQDNSSGFGMIIDTDSTDSSDPALKVQNPNGSLLDVRSDGNIGIGTTSPGQKLHINNSATLTATYQKFTNGTATTGTTLGIDADGDFLINNGEAKEIKLYTDDTQRLTIQSGGNVGIGVTSPDNKLDIDSSYTNSVHIQGTGSYNLYSYHDSGGVGWATGSGVNYDNLLYLDAANDAMRMYTNGNERMRIDSSGNVGIGVTSPSAKLDVFRTINVSSDNDTGYVNSAIILNSTESSARGAGVFMHNTNDDQEWYAGVPYNDAFDSYVIGHKSTASHADSTSELANALLMVESGGNVGIGNTSPSWPLTVGGNVGFKTTAADGSENRFYFQVGGAADPGIFYVYNGAEAVTTQIHGAGASYFNGGNVGIGTTSPAGILTINGTGDAIRVESTNAGAGGAQLDLLHFTASPADEDTFAAINMGGYYTGTTSVYGAQVKSIWTDVSERHSRLEFTTCDTSLSTALTLAHDLKATFTGDLQAPRIGIGAINASFNLYNNGTSYFNGETTIDANLIMSQSNAEINFTSGNGVIQTTTASTSLTFGVNGSEKMRIHSTGDVLIGATNPTSYNSNADDLIIYEANDFSGITLAADNDQGSNIYFADGDDDNVGGITYNHTSNYMMFRVNGASRAEIDSGGSLTMSGDVIAYGSPSDKRLKENIKPIKSALDKVSKLEGVTFNWKESGSILELKEDVGFIAQDVQKVMPELVRENKDGMLSMRHQGIAPILLEAIKELKAEIEELKKQIK